MMSRLYDCFQRILWNDIRVWRAILEGSTYLSLNAFKLVFPVNEFYPLPRVRSRDVG